MSKGAQMNAQPFEEVMTHLHNLLVTGLHDGHYEFTVQVQPQNQRKSRVKVKAGPSRIFVIRDDEIPQN